MVPSSRTQSDRPAEEQSSTLVSPLPLSLCPRIPLWKANDSDHFLYTGQTFDEKVSNASFDYTAMNSFSYGGEQLKDCIIDPSTQPLIIVRPPVANPVMEIIDFTGALAHFIVLSPTH